MIEPVLPCYWGEGLNAYTSQIVGAVLAQTTVALCVSAFVACFVGAWCGRACWYFLHVFVLHRMPKWRRFERAMAKVFA